MFARSLVLVVALVACGSSESDDNSDSSSEVDVSGTVGTSSLTARSAVAWYGVIGSENSQGVVQQVRGLQIFISSKALNCESFTLNNSVTFDLAVFGTQVAPGSYTIIATAGDTPGVGEANANYNEMDRSCNFPVSEGSVRGTLTLTEVASTVAGSVDVSFPGGGTVEGNFEAEFCPETPTVTSGCAG
jgi:hypothetical protein